MRSGIGGFLKNPLAYPVHFVIENSYERFFSFPLLEILAKIEDELP